MGPKQQSVACRIESLGNGRHFLLITDVERIKVEIINIILTFVAESLLYSMVSFLQHS